MEVKELCHFKNCPNCEFSYECENDIPPTEIYQIDSNEFLVNEI